MARYLYPERRQTDVHPNGKVKSPTDVDEIDLKDD